MGLQVIYLSLWARHAWADWHGIDLDSAIGSMYSVLVTLSANSSVPASWASPLLLIIDACA